MKNKKSVSVTCDFCHAYWTEEDYGPYVMCPNCERMGFYDWSGGTPVWKKAVRKLSFMEEKKLHSQNSVTAKEPVYVDHHERLYDYDLFDQHIRYYAGMDSWKAAPPDAEIDKYVQQRQITPEMHDFLEKMAAGKEQMIFEIEEERALQAEEAEYYANYFDEGVS